MSAGAWEARRDAEGRDRTGDTRIFSPLLYQLSYLGEAPPGAGEIIGQVPRPVKRACSPMKLRKKGPDWMKLTKDTPAWAV
jgi:hypothetical protein